MSMPKYKQDDYAYSDDCELPIKFRESNSHMLRLVKYERMVVRGLQPYDPLSLQEDYYFPSLRAKRDAHYDAI